MKPRRPRPANQCIGRLHDAHRRALVLFELDQLEVRVIARQASEQLVLASVGVLILINQQIAQTVLPLAGNFRVILANRDPPNQQGDVEIANGFALRGVGQEGHLKWAKPFHHARVKSGRRNCRAPLGMEITVIKGKSLIDRFTLIAVTHGHSGKEKGAIAPVK